MVGSSGTAGSGATNGVNRIVGDEIKPYAIHVPTKYLELTEQKLRLTRLPHEHSEPKAKDWWSPKPTVEPLIDFWLERYSWREQEDALNEFPQFRTAIAISSSETPLRLHFIHVRSSHSNAVPLLLIPPFPASSLSVGHLGKFFAEPEDPATNQPFHVVIPSLPGLAFSDAFPNNTPVIPTTAEMLNTLMSRLDYPHYLATNTGPGSHSSVEVDWKLANYLATHYVNSCVGTHLVSPPLASPKMREAPLEWAKWSVASLLRAAILGYSKDDFSALARVSDAPPPKIPGATAKESAKIQKILAQLEQAGMGKLNFTEPNTLAYALCDSPVGLLVYVLRSLRSLGPQVPLTPEQVITVAQLAWIPGPEYALRFSAHCISHGDDDKQGGRSGSKKNGHVGAKPRVAITVFLGGDTPASEGTRETAALGRVSEDNSVPELPPPSNEGEEKKSPYACPSWGKSRYNVVFTQRSSGKPGLVPWERPEVIAQGVRGLAKAIVRLDKRLAPAVQAVPAAAPLEQVVVAPHSSTDHLRAQLEQPAADSDRTVVAENEPAAEESQRKTTSRDSANANSIAIKAIVGELRAG